MPVTQFVEQQRVDPPARVAPGGIIVVDGGAEQFGRLRNLQLEVAIWRTANPPLARALAEGTLVLFVVSDEAPWDAIRETAKRCPTIVATLRPDHDEAMLALGAGAFGYLDLTMTEDRIRRTLLGALKGEPAFTRNVMGAWLREARRPQRAGDSSRTDRLTVRQREIVALIAGGATDKEIGARLGIRTATAQKHVANLLRRLGVANRAAAVGVVFKGMETTAVKTSDRRRR